MCQQFSFSVLSRQYAFSLKNRGAVYHMYVGGQFILSFDNREEFFGPKTLLPKLEAVVDELERVWGFLSSDMALQQAAQLMSDAAKARGVAVKRQAAAQKAAQKQAEMAAFIAEMQRVVGRKGDQATQLRLL